MISSLKNIFRRPSYSGSRDVSSRVDYSDSLRKKKREEAHSKFRKLIPRCENTDHNKKISKDLIKTILNEKCTASQLEAAKKIREMSIDNRMVDYSLKLGLLDAIRDKLLQSKCNDLVNEAVWICANISIENAYEILQAKIHVPLIRLMMVPEFTEGCLWAIANISSDSQEARDELLAEGILFHITNLCYQQKSLKIHQQLTSVLLNFTKFSGLSEEIVVQLLALINKYLESDDFEAVYNSLCAITFLVSDEDKNNTVVCAGTLPALVRILNSKNMACEQMAANLLTKLADTVNENNLMEILSLVPRALRNQRAKTTSGILRFITTIAESEDSDLWRKILESEQILQKVIEFVKDGNSCIVEASLELLYELTSRGSYEDIKYLVNRNIIEPVCSILKDEQKLDTLKIALEILEKMLEKSEGYLNYMAFLIEDCGGRDRLDFLLLHYDQNIADIAAEIIAKYFHDDESENKENDSYCPLSMSPIDGSFISKLHSGFTF